MFGFSVQVSAYITLTKLSCHANLSTHSDVRIDERGSLWVKHLQIYYTKNPTQLRFCNENNSDGLSPMLQFGKYKHYQKTQSRDHS